MKRPTRILAIVGALIVLLLALLVVLPLLFRDRIAERVEARGEPEPRRPRRLARRRPHLLPELPQPHPPLDDLTVAGQGRFEGDTLAAVRHLQVVAGPGQRAGKRHGRERADRGPRRRARPAAAPPDRARGRHRQLGHHQEDPGGAEPAAAPSRWRSASAGSRSATPPSTYDDRQGEAQGLARRLQPVPHRRLQPGRWSASRPRPTPTP